MHKISLMVTGASGFVGSNFILKYWEKYNIIPLSLRNISLHSINFDNVDTILHLAALVHQMKKVPEDKYFEINTDLTFNLAKLAKLNGVKHFVFFSSVKVYGCDGDLSNYNLIFTENSPCFPSDSYGKSKYQAEQYLKELEDDNFKVSIIRPPMIYGNGVKGNMQNLIKLITNFPIIPFNYSKNRRTIIGIDNLLYLTHLIIKSRASGIYLATEGEPVSILNISNSIIKGLNKKRLNIRFPKIIYIFLCKIKPDIMKRLYGTLAFKQENMYLDISYSPKFSMDSQIYSLIKKKVDNIL